MRAARQGHSLQIQAALRDEITAIVLVPWTQSVVTFCTVFSGLMCQVRSRPPSLHYPTA